MMVSRLRIVHNHKESSLNHTMLILLMPRTMKQIRGWDLMLQIKTYFIAQIG